MTTTNDTTEADETMQADHLTDETVVALLPKILAKAEQFDVLARAQVAYRDLLNQADDLLAGVVFFADDEFEALAPTVIAGAREMEQTDSQGFVAMGRIMQLQLLVEHPKVVHLAVTRAEQELSQALHRGILPARLVHRKPASVDTPTE
jgi:hypothetical protein